MIAGIAELLVEGATGEVVFLRQADPVLLQALEGEGEAHVVSSAKSLVDGDGVVPAGLVAAGTAIELVPFDEFVGRLEDLADAVAAWQSPAAGICF